MLPRFSFSVAHDSAFGATDLPPDFWTCPDVTRALARRDI
jgi:hypothetical protein